MVMFPFREGPWGGGNQFLKALYKEIGRSGNRAQSIGEADTILVNSHHWNFQNLCSIILWKLKRPSGVVLHRVDGPIFIVREDAASRLLDIRIHLFTRTFSDGTVFQSHWSHLKCVDSGMKPKTAKVITNAPDPEIFFASKKIYSSKRPVRVMVSAWSAHPKKGAKLLEELSRRIDPEKVKITSVGNLGLGLENVNHMGPQSSEQLAGLLRQADIYLALSEDDPCSNALIEAIHCGLVPLALNSGGHPEIVGNSRFLFDDVDGLASLLNTPINELVKSGGLPQPAELDSVAAEYLWFGQRKNQSGRPTRLSVVGMVAFLFLDLFLSVWHRVLAVSGTRPNPG